MNNTEQKVSKLAITSSVRQVMLKNRRSFNGWRYTVPSPDTYPFQWLWDSCFHAIILSKFDVAMAKDELRALISAQWTNGMMPHMIYWQRGQKTIFPDINWGTHHTSSITQPPMLAAAVNKIYQTDGDLSFVKAMLPSIEKFHHYLLRYRDPRKHYLIGVINPDESGEDNSPRFDAALGLEPLQNFQTNFAERLRLVDDYRRDRFIIKNKMDTKHWVRDLPINCILIESLRLEAELHKAVGQLAKARIAMTHRKRMINSMHKHLREDGLYWSSLGLDYKLIKIKTWAMFMPLYAKVASHKEVAIAVEHLLDKNEFNTPYGIPTVAVNEPSFNADGDWRGKDWAGTNWRGPVWIAANWFVVQGLRNYGYNKIADHIVDDSLQLIEKSGFREYYDPLTGEGHGARDFTWSGLVLDMLNRPL